MTMPDSFYSVLINEALLYIYEPEQKEYAKKQLLSFAENELLKQEIVNAKEACKTHFFISGWRPAVGWICVIALAFHYIFRPLLLWLVSIYMPELVIPSSMDDMLWELLLGLLGIGGLRTIEKIKGVAAH